MRHINEIIQRSSVWWTVSIFHWEFDVNLSFYRIFVLFFGLKKLVLITWELKNWNLILLPLKTEADIISVHQTENRCITLIMQIILKKFMLQWTNTLPYHFPSLHNWGNRIIKTRLESLSPDKGILEKQFKTLYIRFWCVFPIINCRLSVGQVENFLKKIEMKSAKCLNRAALHWIHFNQSSIQFCANELIQSLSLRCH